MSLKSVKMHKYNAETLENKQSKANLPKHTVSYLSLGSYNELRLYYTRNKKEKKTELQLLHSPFGFSQRNILYMRFVKCLSGALKSKGIC